MNMIHSGLEFLPILGFNISLFFSFIRHDNHPSGRGSGNKCDLQTVQEKSCNDHMCNHCLDNDNNVFHFGEKMNETNCQIW